MAGLIQKRRSLHKHLEEGNQQNRSLQSQLCKLQPLANIGSASAMIAHEINNILTPFGSYAELALRHIDDRDLVRKALEKAVLNCNRAAQVMESMLNLAHGKTQKKEPVSVLEMVEDIFICLCRDFQKDGISIGLDIPTPLKIQATRVQIQQVLMNLILNAREAMLSQGGALTISARQAGRQVLITVADTGTGIPEAELNHIFGAFYSNKDSTETQDECFGTGLGLAFCRLVMDAHGGKISVSSAPAKGTTFTLALPGAESANVE